MYAISIRQPWAWTIVGGYKDVENRSWPVPSRFVGQRIAIHAGKQLDKSGIAFLMEKGIFGYKGRRFDTGKDVLAKLKQIL